MEEMLDKDEEAAAKWLQEHPVDNKYLRPYQIEAIQATEKAMLDRKRNMLIAMATGTGKTFTTANLIYRLMKSGYAKRILFLVDRKALAAQAVTASSSTKFMRHTARNSAKKISRKEVFTTPKCFRTNISQTPRAAMLSSTSARFSA
jgi:type I site-specific restriction endonuclease